MWNKAPIVILALLLSLTPAAEPAIAQGDTTTWTNSGPYGGTVYKLSVDPTNPNIAYALTHTAVFKTTDGGLSWRSIDQGLTRLDIISLAIHPQQPKKLFAGARDAGTGSGFESTDGGESWHSGCCAAVYNWAIYPPNPSIMYLTAWWSGISKSTDGGAHWQHTNWPDYEVFDIAIDPHNPDTVYGADSCRGIIKTSDGGDHWARTPYPNRSPCVEALTVAPDAQSTVYAGTLSSGVIKSADGGATWSIVNTGLANLYITSLAIDPQAPQTIYAATWAGVYKSTDGAATWQAMSSGLPGGTIGVLAISASNPSTLYAGTAYDGVFKSVDGGASWHSTTRGYSGRRVYALAGGTAPQAPMYAWTVTFGYDWAYGTYRSEDGGASWREVDEGLPNAAATAVAADPQTPRRVYAAIGDTVYHSADGGDNWQAGSGLPGSAVQSLAVDARPPETLYAGTASNGVYTSTDHGATWTAAGSGLGDLAVSAVAVAEHNGARRILAETGGGLYASGDGGASWTLLNAQVLGSTLVVDPRVPSTVYTTGYRSSDGGETWTAMTPPPDSYAVKSLAVAPATSEVYVAAYYAPFNYPTRILRSRDGGATWESIGQGIERYQPFALAVDGRDPAVVYVGTDDGLFAGPNGRRPFSYPVTTQVDPPGAGSVSVSPPPNDGSGGYINGTVVTLTAAPGRGYRFKSWRGDLSGQANPAQLTVTAPFTVTANFEAQQMLYLPLIGQGR